MLMYGMRNEQLGENSVCSSCHHWRHFPGLDVGVCEDPDLEMWDGKIDSLDSMSKDGFMLEPVEPFYGNPRLLTGCYFGCVHFRVLKTV